MTYDQWKDPSQVDEDLRCDCGSGLEHYILSNISCCEKCERRKLLKQLDATLARVATVINEEED